MPLNKITVFYKNDTDQGIGLEMNQDAFKKENLKESLKILKTLTQECGTTLLIKINQMN